MKKRSFLSVILYVAILALIFSLILGLFAPRHDGLTYSEILGLFQDEQVKSFEVQEQTITLKKGKKEQH